MWLDALTSYLTGLGFGTGEPELARWWLADDVERVHVVGKGIVRFHAVYWCAFLLAAGLPLPDAILVHDYVTVDGAKIGKSLGNGVDPFGLVDAYGSDALRWWLLREVPRVGDADFTEHGLVSAANRDLANGVGNLVQRVAALAAATGVRVDELVAAPLAAEAQVRAAVDAAIDDFDFRRALGAILDVVDIANRHLERSEPWRITDPVERAEAMAPALHAARLVARELEPFVPRLAASARDRLASLRTGEPLFARLVARQHGAFADARRR